jgi:hypothetical protein
MNHYQLISKKNYELYVNKMKKNLQKVCKSKKVSTFASRFERNTSVYSKLTT